MIDLEIQKRLFELSGVGAVFLFRMLMFHFTPSRGGRANSIGTKKVTGFQGEVKAKSQFRKIARLQDCKTARLKLRSSITDNPTWIRKYQNLVPGRENLVHSKHANRVCRVKIQQAHFAIS